MALSLTRYEDGSKQDFACPQALPIMKRPDHSRPRNWLLEASTEVLHAVLSYTCVNWEWTPTTFLVPERG